MGFCQRPMLEFWWGGFYGPLPGKSLGSFEGGLNNHENYSPILLIELYQPMPQVELKVNMCVCIHTYTYMYVHIYICIHIY